jgi:hypothetical protein
LILFFSHQFWLLSAVDYCNQVPNSPVKVVTFKVGWVFPSVAEPVYTPPFKNERRELPRTATALLHLRDTGTAVEHTQQLTKRR